MKNKLLIVLLTVCLACSLVGAVSFAHAEDAAATGGEISISKDYTTYAAYDMSWQTEPEVCDFGGNLTISPSTRSLGTGKQNSSSAGEGYVSYLVEAPDGNVIKTLAWSAYGRAFHSSGNADCSAGTCICGYELSVSIDGGLTFTKVSTESIVTSGSSHDFSYDLTGICADKSSAVIKLYMSGKSWDWVCMERISITGTYDVGEATTAVAGKFAYENGVYAMGREFESLPHYDMSWTNDHAVYAYDGYITVSPDGAYGLGVGKQNTTSSGSGYVSYLIEAPEGNELTSGKFSWKGRAYHSTSNSECAAGNCSCAFVVEISTDGGNSYQTVKDEEIVTSGSTKDFEYDFTDLVNGAGSAIIKINLTGKSWNWVHIKNLAITGTYAEKAVDPDAPTIVEKNISDDFTNTQISASHIYKYNGVGSDANSHGIVPGAWSGTINVSDDAWVMYEIKPALGCTFEALSLVYNAKIWNQDNGIAHDENAIYVYAGASEDSLVEINRQGQMGSDAADVTVDLTEAAKGKDVLYVKIKLNLSKAIGDAQDLSYVGVKLFKTDFTYSYDGANELETEDFSATQSAADMWANGENVSLQIASNIGGQDLIYVDGSNGYGIYEIACNDLKEFYTLQAKMRIRVTNYGGNVYSDIFKVYASADKAEWTLIDSLDTDSGWARNSYNFDFSAVAKGNNKIYVKVEISWPDGTSESRDWVGFGVTEYTGKVVDRTNFDIIYNNVEGASHSNPASYDKGDEIALEDAVKENYTFGGWFVGADLTEAFAGITADTVGNVVVYAKWIPVAKTVTLNANGGAFANGSELAIAVDYNSAISKELITEEPTSDTAFIGWFKEAECINPWIFEGDYGVADIVTEDITLYAKYGAKISVTFKYEDGVTADVNNVYVEGEKAAAVADPAREGYVFGGWYNGDALYDFDAELTANIVLTAKWYEIFSITYNGVEGASHENASSYIVTDAVIALADAAKTGYTFLGWFEGEAEVESIDPAEARDIALTAKWQVNVYSLTVNADANSSVNTEDTEISFEGKTFTVSANEGYRIALVTVNNEAVNVNENGEFTVSGIAGDVVIAVTSVERHVFGGSINVAFNDSEDFIASVYDVANVERYTAASDSKYYGWLTTSDRSKPGYIAYGIELGGNKTIKTAVLSGVARIFQYDGSAAVLKVYASLNGSDWTEMEDYACYTDGGKTTAIDLALTSMAKGASKLYVKYEIQSGNYDWVCLDSVKLNVSLDTVTVTFLDGEELIDANAEQIKGEAISLIADPVKAGYDFLGWYIDEECTVALEEGYIVSSAMAVYAKWARQSFVINYVVDGGDAGANPESYTIADEIVLEAAVKENHKFLGWYLTEDFSGEAVPGIAAGTSGDITLYAKFLAGQAIVYELDGGLNSLDNPTHYYSDETTVLSDPTKEGSTFAGWYADAECTILVTEIAEGTEGEVTVYAKWIEDSIPEGEKPGTSSEEASSCSASMATIPALAGLMLLGAAMLKKKEN